MDRSRIAIVIPALNEARTIASVVARVAAYGVPLVVDDGSRDDTAALARAAGADVVSHAVNRGYDEALNSGFARAAERGCAYVITVDADGQHNPQQIADFIAQLDQGCTLVLGVRDRQQRFGEQVFAWVARRVWGLSDPLCGMKGYRMSLYRDCGAFDRHGSIGTELAIRGAARGARRIELPTVIRDRVDSPRFGRRLAANLKILRAMFILLALGTAGRLSR
jgi:glycosyltransferase involved in cell wall biosynthesis